MMNPEADNARGRRDTLRVIAEASRAFATSTEEDAGLFDVIAGQLAEGIGDCCALFTSSDGGNTLTLAALRCSNADFVRECRAGLATPMPISSRPDWQRVLRTGEPLLVPRIDSQDAADSAPGLHSRLVVALRMRGEPIGLLALSRFKPESPAYDDADRELAAIIADQAALAIGSARAHAALQPAKADDRRDAAASERLRVLTDVARVGMVMVGRDHRYRYANRSYVDMLRLTSPDLVGERVCDVLPSIYDDQIRPQLDRAFAGERVTSELTLPATTGSDDARTCTVTYEPSSDAGEPVVVAVLEDVTERKWMTKALAQREQQLSLFIAHSPAALAMFDRDMRYIAASRRWLTDYGLPDDPLSGRSHNDVFNVPERWKEAHRRALAGAVERREEDSFQLPDGRTAWLRWEIRPWHTPGGDIGGIVIFTEDITVQTLANRALRESEERFREIAENIRDVFWITNVEKTRMLYVSPAYEVIWGRSREQLYESARDWLNAIHPDDRDRVAHAAVTGQAVDAYQVTYRIVLEDGTTRWIHDRAFPIRDAAGNVIRIVGLASDITKERTLGEQFRQAQKMEAVGRLAGGVAHDFNNTLSVILSYAELMLAAMPADDEIRADVAEIRTAGLRAAELTRQLLQFSRQQVTQPKVVDVNDALSRLEKMLGRLIGEDIELALDLRATGRVRIDPTGIDQIVMNLVVNARDAMPTGGTITVSTSDMYVDAAFTRNHVGFKEGPHVVLAVSDTGCGMDEATQARVFEPFFTTKEKGKGTGLGLSTVFGIATHSGGNILVDSQPGAGATFRIVLPSLDSPTDPQAVVPAPTRQGGTETLLLVEDDPQLRTVARNILRHRGYKVIEASNGVDALAVCEREPAIDLLVTDVVMPQMSGPELARRLVAARPALRVLCMSGYTDESVVRHGLLDGLFEFLEKPITPETLTRRVREVLDAAG